MNVMAHILQSARPCGFQHRKTGAGSGFGTQKAVLFPYIGGISSGNWQHGASYQCPADHVHILALLPAKAAVSDILAKVKANSSGWVHRGVSREADFCLADGLCRLSA